MIALIIYLMFSYVFVISLLKADNLRKWGGLTYTVIFFAPITMPMILGIKLGE